MGKGKWRRRRGKGGTLGRGGNAPRYKGGPRRLCNGVLMRSLMLTKSMHIGGDGVRKEEGEPCGLLLREREGGGPPSERESPPWRHLKEKKDHVLFFYRNNREERNNTGFSVGDKNKIKMPLVLKTSNLFG